MAHPIQEPAVALFQPSLGVDDIKCSEYMIKGMRWVTDEAIENGDWANVAYDVVQRHSHADMSLISWRRPHPLQRSLNLSDARTSAKHQAMLAGAGTPE